MLIARVGSGGFISITNIGITYADHARGQRGLGSYKYEPARVSSARAWAAAAIGWSIN